MIIFGKQPVMYALQTCPWRFEEIYLAKELARQDFLPLSKLDKPIKRIDSKKAQALAHGGNHQGILVKLTPPQEESLQSLKTRRSLLVLCGISDVGNIGSIFRTAYAMGVEGVAIILPSLSPKAREGIARLSSGAFLSLPYGVFSNVLDVAHELKEEGFTLLGADMEGKGSIQAPQKWALFLGSESQGLSARLKHKLDTILSIKMHHSFDSLNVAVATGILLDRITHARAD